MQPPFDIENASTESTHPLLRLIAERKPQTISFFIDGTEVFKAKFTGKKLEPIFDLEIDKTQPMSLMTVGLDDDPTPVYSLRLDGETV